MKLRNSFVTGIVVILPAIITIIIIRYLFLTINNLILNPILGLFAPHIKGSGLIYFKYLIKGLIFVCVLGLIVLIGVATRSIILRRLFSFGERLLYKIPMVNKIYTSIREVTNAFLAHGKTVFQRVVLVEYPRKGIYSLGFVTSESRGEVQVRTKECLINVFVPTTPNPTSGVFFMVPEESAINLDMTVEGGLKLVISGGAITPSYTEEQSKRGHELGELGE